MQQLLMMKGDLDPAETGICFGTLDRKRSTGIRQNLISRKYEVKEAKLNLRLACLGHCCSRNLIQCVWARCLGDRAGDWR